MYRAPGQLMNASPVQLGVPLVDRDGSPLPERGPVPKWAAQSPAALELAMRLLTAHSADELLRNYADPAHLLTSPPAGSAEDVYVRAVQLALTASGHVFDDDGVAIPYVEALTRMCPVLRRRMAGFMAPGNTTRAFHEQYCILHEEEFGQPFRLKGTGNARASGSSGRPVLPGSPQGLRLVPHSG